MNSSSSVSSGLSKCSSQDSLSASSKTKKKKGFLTHLSRPSTHSSSSRAKDAECMAPKIKPHLTTFESKSSTLPRPPKPPKTALTPPTGATPPKKALGRFTLSKTSSATKNEKASSKSSKISSNLSFSELRKQHQQLVKSVDDLQMKLSESEEKHKKDLQDVCEKLEESNITVNILKEDVRNKEAQLKEKDICLSELQSQLDRAIFDKERLLMVIESAQRDALTGEPISHDISMWQQAREENKARTQEFSRLLDSMMESLQSNNDELQEQAESIKTSCQLVTL